MILSAPALRLKVAPSVIALGVNHIHERSDFGESFAHVIHDESNLLGIVLAKDDDEHQFAS